MNFDRTSKILLVITGIGIWLVAFILLFPNTFSFIGKSAKAQPIVLKSNYDSLTVHKLTVVNENGKPQFVISDSSHFPPPVINGKVYPRSISPTGALFYDQNGNEIGGLAFINREKKDIKIRRGQMTLDAKNSDVISLGVVDARPAVFYTGLEFNAPVPLDADIMKTGSVGNKRIQIYLKNEKARIILRDKNGEKRLVLGIDSTGSGFIHFMKNGKIIQKISP